MRPLLGVMFVPSTPMNDERLSTSGSFRITRARACWRSAMAVERHGLRRLGDAEDHAGVLHGEEALGHDDVERDRQDQRRDRDHQGGRLMAEHPGRA